MTPTLRRRILRKLMYVLVLGAPVALFFLIAMPRASAARLLRRLQAVQVNQTPFTQVFALASEFRHNAVCVGGDCVFQFQNTWLHRLHLAPLTQFSVMLHRRAGDPGQAPVGAMEMALLVNREPPDAIASATVFERGGLDPSGPYHVTVTPGRTVVTVAARATARQRRRARAFNLSCLTRIGGCRTSRDLLPQVWSVAPRN